ncbi:flagellar filament capping protein FliD [bacterium]|nr:flagellar filament capping protein FliD [bacterium]
MSEVGATDNIGSSLINSMNVGSGVNISELAEALATAETAAKKSLTTTKKDQAKAAISGVGVLTSSLSNLSASLDTLTDKSAMADKSVTTQNADRIEAKITAQTKAQAGTHKIHCRSLARAQINQLEMASGTFSSATQALNGGSAFNLSIASPAGGSATTVTVSTATPDGIVAAINEANVNGVRAYTMNASATGTAVSIMLEGKTGAANTFTVTDASSISNPSSLVTQNTSNKIQGASDLQLVVNRVSDADTTEFIYRDTNSPSDVITGVQLNFKQATASGVYTTTNVVVSEDRSSFTTALTNVQSAYNELIDVAGVLVGELESESTYASTLKKDRGTVQSILLNIRSTLTATSSTPSDPINSIRQLGVGFDLSGKLTIEKTTLDSAIISNFSDVTKMLTANTDNQSSFSSADKGLAQDTINVIDGFTDINGVLTVKKDTNSKALIRYETELSVLEEKYEAAKKRYMTQFAAMETLVQRSKSTGDYLTQQFDAMNGGND